MGVIGTSTIDIHGKRTDTEVQTNEFDDFLIRMARRFGQSRMWRVIHWIEKRKLTRK
jgi:hypothetical protein